MNPEENSEQQNTTPTSGAEAPASSPPEAPQVPQAPESEAQLASDGEQVREGLEEGDADAS